jgi:sterol desaturase/sphingolipid hydroxylase (fatty acid hydroxylase superfamily)
VDAEWWAAIVIRLAPVFAIILAGQIAEAVGRTPPRTRRPVAFNILVVVVNEVLLSCTMPMLWLLLTPVVDHWGGGGIRLPSNGLWLVPSVLVYLFVTDFGEFVFHVAQHRFAWLWAMHALHHSDTALNVSTGGRHYWFEFLIKAVVIYAPILVLFRVGMTLMGWFAVVKLLNFVHHLDVRVGFGAAAAWLASPQYHRIHHSADPRHLDKNFAAYFAVFDRLFGTQYLPARDEYPETGLDTLETPSIADAVLWPLRRTWRRLRPFRSADGAHGLGGEQGVDLGIGIFGLVQDLPRMFAQPGGHAPNGGRAL